MLPLAWRGGETEFYYEGEFADVQREKILPTGAL